MSVPSSHRSLQKKTHFIAYKAIPMIAFHRVKSCVTHTIEHALKLYRQQEET